MLLFCNLKTLCPCLRLTFSESKKVPPFCQCIDKKAVSLKEGLIRTIDSCSLAEKENHDNNGVYNDRIRRRNTGN